MPGLPLPAISRYAIIVACIAAAGAIATGVIDHMNEAKIKAMYDASQQCQEDLLAQITLFQDHFAAEKGLQAAGKPRDPVSTIETDEKLKAIQAFKSRC